MSATDPLIQFLSRLISAESVSGNEHAAIAIWAEYAEQHGFKTVVNGRNVWCEKRVNDGPAILFNSHLDTVKASASWTRDPWDGAIEEDRVHGLGANDAKGCVVAQLGAAIQLVESGWDGNVVVCASCDEETGGEGMEIIARDLLPSYQAAVIGEPNNYLVARGQRGLIKGYLHVPGQRAHASRPWQGHNAIHAAAKVITSLEQPHLNVPDDLTRATVQVTVIEGGVQSNVLPDSCKLTVDCRTTPEFNNDAMLAHLTQAVEAQGGTFEQYSNRFLPVHTPDDSELVKAAMAATGRTEPTVFPSVCDLFWVSHVPAIVMGPGQPVRSHQADEFVRIPEVLEGVQKYADTARGWWNAVRPS